ncbi:unnamed protein product, partial [Owenia fusiformis]
IKRNSINSNTVVNINTVFENPNTAAVNLNTAAVNLSTADVIAKKEVLDETDDILNKSLVTNTSDVIKILLWTRCFGHRCLPLGTDAFKDCDVPHCEVINNRSQIEQAQVVMFHTCTVNNLNDVGGPPKYRSPSQKWIFRCSEPPTNIRLRKYPGMSDAFNFTMTTRLDSDFHMYHGLYTINPNPPKVLPDYTRGKTKLVAWIVSHCHTRSRREVYVQKLQEFIPVDIYGRCGWLDCPRSKEAVEEYECFKNVGATYKFYLSFENSDCRDYVTEKVWRNAIMMDILPVVRGFYNNFKTILPPGSYIHTNDFPNPEALAKYLKYLDKNDTAYNEYFSWKLT